MIRNCEDPANAELSEPYVCAVPKDYVPGSRMGLIFCHAYGELPANWLNDGVYLGTKYQNMLHTIIRQGYPFIFSSYTYGANNADGWGNDAAIAKVEAARVYLQGTLGAKSGPVLLMGSSMGGLTILNYTLAHPTSVKTSVLICPVTDLNSVHNNGTFTASIDAAYSGSYVDATYGDAHSPIKFCSLLRSIPTQLWIADDDVIADPVTAAIAISAMQGAEVHHMLGGHNNITDLDVTQVLNWLAAHE